MIALDRPLMDRELAAVPDADWRAEREAAVARQAARVAVELAESGETVCTTRGKPQAVVCLDAHGYDGRALRFPTSSDAGRFLVVLSGGQATADHVRRAIVRGGTCGGRRFGWANGRRVTTANRERELSR